VRAYGTESDHWIGKMIEMFLGAIQYQGSDHEAVLVRPITPPVKDDKVKDDKAADQKKAPPSADEMSDEIPF
jgi:hypothetical protein